MNLKETIGWSSAFGVVAVASILSNAITLVVFTSKDLKRKLCYYLPVNLAVTDLMVGIVALPLCVSVLNLSNTSLRLAFIIIDIITGVTSVATIALISLERLCAIGWPLKHRLLETKHYIIGITFTWLYAITFLIMIRFVSTLHEETQVFRARVMLCGIGIPLITALGANILLYRMRKMSAVDLQRKAEMQRKTKLAQTLLILTVVFYLTWLPFTVIAIICGYGLCPYIPIYVQLFTVFLHFSNSFANSIIYALRIPVFRSALRKRFYNKAKG